MKLTDTESLSLCQLGYTYYCCERFDDAETIFRGLSTLAPELTYPWQALGHIAVKRRDFVLAERCYQRALLLDPENDTVRLALCEVLLNAQQSNGRVREMLEELTHDGTQPEVQSRAKALWKRRFL